ncbi:MAG: hypothetical protein KA100_06935 [Rickettsiales bacterium]|nr:hypothetical protein [Rickettsiales bacterium]
MKKTNLAFLILALLSIFLAYKFFSKYGKQEIIIEKQEEKIDQQNQQIEKKNEVIETKNLQQKIISKTSVNLDVAARSEWMQLVFEEREAANN